MKTFRNATATLLTTFALLALGACSGSDSANDTVAAERAAPTETLYIVGSGTSVGDELPDSLREAWPRVLYAEAFSRSTVLVNGAAGPSTVAEALDRQLPLARELRPETIAVWLGSFDLNEGTPATEFGADLRTLLRGLVDSDATRVAIANLPRLPAYDETQRSAYNTEIAAASLANGVDLVDIADLTLTPVSSAADYQPDTAGHRLIADAFAEAFDSS